MIYLNQAALYLLQIAFGVYLLLVLLRLLFQFARADFYNPFSQFIVTLTQPPIKTLRRFIPGFFGIDFATVVLLVVVQLAEIYVLAWLLIGVPALAGVLVLALARLIRLTVYVYIFAVFARALLSWINPYGTRHPLGDLLYSLTEPLLAPARRLIPQTQGIDFSPLVVGFLLILTLMLIVQPIADLSYALDPRLSFLPNERPR
jgi:YggT family protein